jgi:hypothetical protein
VARAVRRGRVVGRVRAAVRQPGKQRGGRRVGEGEALEDAIEAEADDLRALRAVVGVGGQQLVDQPVSDSYRTGGRSTKTVGKRSGERLR